MASAGAGRGGEGALGVDEKCRLYAIYGDYYRDL
jgi:hypothetical protein